jgi:hypothetical protein
MSRNFGMKTSRMTVEAQSPGSHFASGARRDPIRSPVIQALIDVCCLGTALLLVSATAVGIGASVFFLFIDLG